MFDTICKMTSRVRAVHSLFVCSHSLTSNPLQCIAVDHLVNFAIGDLNLHLMVEKAFLCVLAYCHEGGILN